MNGELLTNNNMRVLFIGESYLPQLCGMTSVTRYLAEGLVNKGYQVSIATQSHFDYDKDIEILNGVEVNRFRIGRNLLKYPTGELSLFIDFVLHSECDVYIFECIGSLTSDILMPYIDKIKGLKILHTHGNSFKTMRPFVIRQNFKFTFGNTYNYLRLWLQNLYSYPKFIKSFDEVIILSSVSSDKEIVCANACKYEVLDNAADDIFFEEYNRTEPLNYPLQIKYNKYIISVANFQKVKNQMLMVRSYYESDVTDVSLVMIGSKKNDYYQLVADYVSKQSKKYPGKDVVMLTDVEREKIPNILKFASLYLVCSEKEEYSISLIEAMSLGIPFVSTNVGNACILPGGIAVQNVNQLPNAITKMISDDKLRIKYSRDARIYADNHNRESIVVDKLEMIINSLYNIEK